MRSARVVFVGVALTVLMLAGCGEGDWMGTTVGPSTTAHTPPKFGDTVSAWGVETTVRSTQLPVEDSTTLNPGEGKQVFLIIVNIENTGNKPFVYSLDSWEATDQSGNTHQPSVGFGQSGLTSGTVPPGGSAGGYVGFQLPNGSTLASVTLRPADSSLQPDRLTWQR